MARRYPAHLQRAAELTEQFYAWDYRLRGYDVWPYPVSPEPAFVPFLPDVDQHEVTDDARSHTLLSWATQKVKDAVLGRAAPLPTPEPYFTDEDYLPDLYAPSGELCEYQISLPRGIEYAPTRFEQLLTNLKSLRQPMAFEIIANEQHIVVQLACREFDAVLIEQHLEVMFPDAIVTHERHFLTSHFEDLADEALVVDFGLDNETAISLPVRTPDRLDSLATVIAALSTCQDREAMALQILVNPVRAPWASALVEALRTPDGKSFFADAPELAKAAVEKTRTPLFGTVLRLCVATGDSGRREQLMRQLGAAVSQFNNDRVQGLIPLSNEDYPDFLHVEDVLERRTHRSGMILSATELTGFVHLPMSSVASAKLIRPTQKTKELPINARGHDFVLGQNEHRGERRPVTQSPDMRMRHTYIVGASGTGKSTLLLNLIRQDMNAGNGVALLDPHGDLVDDVLRHVPPHRMDDVVLLDPADEDWPIGLNIFDARSEAEKTLLSSDLVAVFRRLSTSWGDQMNAILANSIIAMLEHPDGGTLLTLRRFLVENTFRRQFIAQVQDEEVRYYWEKEYPLLRGKPQAPVLTRLDTFLRSKLIRLMVAQPKNSVDFSEVMDGRKIFLARLSHGAIGEENAHLLGTLLVTALNQAAQRRQAMSRDERKPFFVYIDEFQNFVTPTMESILSGSRKFNMALTLAHQDLRQLSSRNQDVAHSVLSNPSTRVCFRCGDSDAVSLARGFSSFDAEDLQQLGIGQAVVRIEQSQYDCNVAVEPPAPSPAERDERVAAIIDGSRQRYGTPISEVEALLRNNEPSPPPEPRVSAPPEATRSPETKKGTRSEHDNAKEMESPPKRPRRQRRDVSVPQLTDTKQGRGGTNHRYLQNLVKKLAEERGFTAEIEAPVLGRHGFIDVLLTSSAAKIACEIAIASPAEYEVKNVQKCLAAGADHVVVLGYERVRHQKLERHIREQIDKESLQKLNFLLPEAFLEFLDATATSAIQQPKTIRGYKVLVSYHETGRAEQKQRQAAIAKLIVDSMRRMRADE
ncbi:MAG: type IV secretion system DNA-binding domain-containing protein [Pseudomonadota bacterium]